jgi:hypothetical protein
MTPENWAQYSLDERHFDILSSEILSLAEKLDISGRALITTCLSIVMGAFEGLNLESDVIELIFNELLNNYKEKNDQL